MGTNWVAGLRRWARAKPGRTEPVIGLALGGGFARAIAHLGVIRVLEENGVPIHRIAGVSAGAIVAAGYASGSTTEEIIRAARGMKFSDVASWSISLLGLAGSERMTAFLKRLLKVTRFEDMRTPLAVVATDLASGEPVVFHGQGDVCDPVRASCSYPGLFQPVRHRGRVLVDGAMSMEVPAAALRSMGTTHVISVYLPVHGDSFDARNMFQVINRSFQILQARCEWNWRKHSSVVIAPDMSGMSWDCFGSTERLLESGVRAARQALPRILSWLDPAPGKQAA